MNKEETQLRTVGSSLLATAQSCPTDRELVIRLSALMPNAYQSALLVCAFAARWAQLAFPVLDLRTDQVASLSLTDSDPAKMPVVPPWPAYLLRLASGSFPVKITGPSGTERLGQCECIGVISYSGPAYEIRQGSNAVPFSDGYHETHLFTDVESVVLHGGTRTLSEMYSNCDLGSGGDGKVPLEETEERATAMGQRLVLSSMVAAAAHGFSRAKTTRPKGKRWVSVAEGQRCTFILGTPVTIADGHSSELSDYLSGVSRIIRKSRWVVRGHWRNQVHGKENSLRKTIWVAPFWSGPAGLPARVKDYRIG